MELAVISRYGVSARTATTPVVMTSLTYACMALSLPGRRAGRKRRSSPQPMPKVPHLGLWPGSGSGGSFNYPAQ